MRKKQLMAAVMAVLALATCFMIAGCSKPVVQQNDDTLRVSDKTNSFYVLIVGNDSRIGTYQIDNSNYSDGTARSDVIMLARIDLQTYNVALISVPRDTRCNVNGSETKMNEAYHQNGMEGLKKEIESLTGVNIKYTMDMGFVQFEKFIDGLGGLTVNVPVDMSLKDMITGKNVSIGAGEKKLNGAEALVLARTRKIYAGDMDAVRQIQDRKIVQEGIKQMAADPAKVAANIQVLADNCTTDWPAADLASIAADFALHAKDVTFNSGTGPYEGGGEDPASGLWLIPRDESTWKAVIAAAENGRSLKGVVSEPEVELL